MNYHVVICTLAGRYRYLDSYETWAAAKSNCVYYAHRGGTAYITNNAPLAMRFMASDIPTSHIEFSNAVDAVRRRGSKVQKVPPRCKNCCPWCEYDGSPKRSRDPWVQCLCPRCGELSEKDAWFLKYQGRTGYTWFNER